MDTQKLLNKYIASLGEQVKQLTMEKTMLSAQLALTQEELEEMKKKLDTSPASEENSQWQQ
jgi:predicted RNase H-like nuclease (RuvC/YqgF family)